MDEFILYYNTNPEDNTEWYHRNCCSMEVVENEAKDLKKLVGDFPIQFKLFKQVEFNL